MNLSNLTFIPAFTMAALLLAGCQTYSPSQYLSPRVTGRVLDARTRQTIPDVLVRRVRSDESLRGLDPSKGGQAMAQAPAVRTGPDGEFVLDSLRNLAFFRKVGWYSVSLSFERAGYERLVTTYTLKDATKTSKGEPLVKAKDILLIPLAK